MDVRLHCLGTTGYHPSPKRHTACYYLPDWQLMLDAGTGLFRLTKLLLEEPQEKITILLSHAHLDHVVGLTFLLDTLAVTSLKEIVVVGMEDKLRAIQKHLYHENLFPVPPAFHFQARSGTPASRIAFPI